MFLPRTKPSGTWQTNARWPPALIASQTKPPLFSGRSWKIRRDGGCLSFTADRPILYFKHWRVNQRNCNDMERDTGDDGLKKSDNFDFITEGPEVLKVQSCRFFLGAKCIAALTCSTHCPASLIFWVTRWRRGWPSYRRERLPGRIWKWCRKQSRRPGIPQEKTHKLLLGGWTWWNLPFFLVQLWCFITCDSTRPKNVGLDIRSGGVVRSCVGKRTHVSTLLVSKSFQHVILHISS